MARFSASRGTVNKALHELEMRGVLLRRRGAGTFVKQILPPHSQVGRQVALLFPWAIEGEPFGYIQHSIHTALANICSQNNFLLSLHCLPAGGATLRDRMLSAARTLLNKNIQLVLYCPHELPREQMHWNREVVDLLIDGGARVVMIDRDIACYPDRSQFTWISYDNIRGGAMLARHMVNQGYRRIAFVGLHTESTAVAQRLSGYLDGLRSCGVTPDSHLIFAPESMLHVNDDFCQKIMNRRPDAILCKDIDQTTRIYRWLSQRGIKIGPEIGLAGFDDAPIAAQMPVPLTVVRQPVEPFVTAVFRVIQSFMSESERPYDGEQIVIRTELMIRESTCRK